MKKNEYAAPKMKIVALKRRGNLLQGSANTMPFVDGEVSFKATFSDEMAPKA